VLRFEQQNSYNNFVSDELQEEPENPSVRKKLSFNKTDTNNRYDENRHPNVMHINMEKVVNEENKAKNHFYNDSENPKHLIPLQRNHSYGSQPALKTERTELEREKRNRTNKIPLGNSKRSQIQNSAPQNKKSDIEFMDTIFSSDDRSKQREEIKDRSISNDRSSNKAGSNWSHNSKIIVQKIDHSVNGSLQSSYLSSNFLSFNLSVSESAEHPDVQSQESKRNYQQNDNHIPPFNVENELLWSGHTLDLSEDNENDQLTESEHQLSVGQLQNDYTYPKMNQNNKILIHQTYMDENRKSDTFDQIHINIENKPMYTHTSYDSHMRVQYPNHPAYTEESKMVLKTGDLDIDNDNSSNFYHNTTSPGIATVNINLPTDQSEEIEIQKSLFDQNSKSYQKSSYLK
jgi:hypothetical protein